MIALWREFAVCGTVELLLEDVTVQLDFTKEVQLVDQVKCVECGHVWYVASTGRSSRSFKGLCIGDHRGVSKAITGKEGSEANVPKGRAS